MCIHSILRKHASSFEPRLLCTGGNEFECCWNQKEVSFQKYFSSEGVVISIFKSLDEKYKLDLVTLNLQLRGFARIPFSIILAMLCLVLIIICMLLHWSMYSEFSVTYPAETGPVLQFSSPESNSTQILQQGNLTLTSV